jgi:D-mannonate dehydratase
MVSETLANPGAEIFDVIHYFGTRGKLFDVHFRNIRGHRDDFVETHPDDGDVDFLKAAILRLRLRLHPRSYSICGRTELSEH